MQEGSGDSRKFENQITTAVVIVERVLGSVRSRKLLKCIFNYYAEAANSGQNYKDASLYINDSYSLCRKHPRIKTVQPRVAASFLLI